MGARPTADADALSVHVLRRWVGSLKPHPAPFILNSLSPKAQSGVEYDPCAKCCRQHRSLQTLLDTLLTFGTRDRFVHCALLAALMAISLFGDPRPTLAMAEKASAPASACRIPATGSDAPSEQARTNASSSARAPLIVIGFMGGRIHAGNLAHGEARLARDLDQQYPKTVHAMTFANHDAAHALRTLLSLLGTSQDGRPSEAEKASARIILFGHSWGGSETVHFARELNRRGIPVLLTVQVDSVEKSGEDDGSIPPNVREAINFYQSEGLLHGRRAIQAIDPKRTTILGSYKPSYKRTPVSCTGYSWFARTFMKPHIEMENDRALWSRIEALIVARSCAGDLPGMMAECAPN
jgi:hypothetical protein